MSEKLEVGDIVQMKSGGPEMAVLILDGEEAVCALSTDRGLERRKVSVSLLSRVDGKTEQSLPQ
ncbi:MAG TPA: DUF2158 domain-containing protein [Spirochaetia bacterium]|nr:DUF2158 domain-containing protein [Spirochaetia bacterium]